MHHKRFYWLFHFSIPTSIFKFALLYRQKLSIEPCHCDSNVLQYISYSVQMEYKIMFVYVIQFARNESTKFLLFTPSLCFYCYNLKLGI